MSSSSETKAVRRDLERRGFTISKTNGGHWRYEHPDMDGAVYGADTPSDRRSIRNLLAIIRRKFRVAIDI